jgi:hypothetical protein
MEKLCDVLICCPLCLKYKRKSQFGSEIECATCNDNKYCQEKYNTLDKQTLFGCIKKHSDVLINCILCLKLKSEDQFGYEIVCTTCTNKKKSKKVTFA